MSVIARILDANFNRAREAFRVMEDVARFARNDAEICSSLKNLRHELQSSMESLPGGWLEVNRDAAADVGTSISTSSEMHRGCILDVAIAAGKRLSEALRVIEELLKTIDGEAARRIEAIRYRGYDIDAQLQIRLGSGKARQWNLCLILTRSLCRRPWQEVLQAALENGCECVQIREKQTEGGDLVKHVREVLSLSRPLNPTIIVNDRPDVALAAGAHGVHVGQNDLSVRDVRRIAGRELIVGVSTHDMSEAQAAVIAGADYCGVGAMFATSIKPEREPAGPECLSAFIERFPSDQVPHLAIGGITPGNVGILARAGCRGVAVSSAICRADDPGQVSRAIIESLVPAKTMTAG
jgi:thiamine-phosphate pyrophosphorylase